MNTDLKGLNRKEIRYLGKLLPVFLKFSSDRNKSKRQEEYNYKIEKHGRAAVNTFIELGPTFIKLGQVLSARPDLLPKEYLKAFSDLQDKVPPDNFAYARALIEENVGAINKVFGDFNENAISGASLGQVYRATYMGIDAAVKVNRHNIDSTIKSDLIVIKKLLKTFKRFIDNYLYISISNVLSDFSARIYDETNYMIEAENIKRIRNNIKKYDIIIPDILFESKQVLILTYIEGIKVTDVKKLKQKGIDLPKLAHKLDLTFIRMLLRNDIFHADPHPGNIAISNEGKIILYDFGMVGKLDDDTRFKLLKLYDGLINKDPDTIMDSLLQLNALSPAANRGIIRKGIELSIANLSGANVNEMDIRELLEIANNVIFEFPFHLPRELVLYMRMSSLLEGICKTLDPNFKFVLVLRDILYNEGMLQELYRKEINEFVQKSIISIEKGLDVLPLLKRSLEERGGETKENKKLPETVFLSAVLIAMILFSRVHPVISYIIIIIDIILFAFILKK
ncbi:AarF/UbiB family protein [Ferroplasma sp.]|uniref:ABC1 kinase family protein n=1 Tax=Ferroplasma sp. TaxID=2591003 RepID=UPI00307FCDAC